MNRQSVVGGVVAVAVGALLGCAHPDAPPGPGGPTLSLVGASGVSADVQRTVTEISGGVETVLSVVDTTVWAPFDDRGSALASSDEAGAPGPLGWRDTGDERELSVYGSFVDGAGVLHKIWASGARRGRLESLQYHRQGVPAIEYRGAWVDVTGGSVLEREAMTFYLADLPALRLDLVGRDVRVASATPFTGLLALGSEVTDLLRPRPLAAQFYFSACAKEWLGWTGAALLAELAWVKFAKTKSYKYFKLAVAATGAAGVTLDQLVDCMVSQSPQPE